MTSPGTFYHRKGLLVIGLHLCLISLYIYLTPFLLCFSACQFNSLHASWCLEPVFMRVCCEQVGSGADDPRHSLYIFLRAAMGPDHYIGRDITLRLG